MIKYSDLTGLLNAIVSGFTDWLDKRKDREIVSLESQFYEEWIKKDEVK